MTELTFKEVHGHKGVRCRPLWNWIGSLLAYVPCFHQVCFHDGGRMEKNLFILLSIYALFATWGGKLISTCMMRWCVSIALWIWQNQHPMSSVSLLRMVSYKMSCELLITIHFQSLAVNSVRWNDCRLHFCADAGNRLLGCCPALIRCNIIAFVARYMVLIFIKLIISSCSVALKRTTRFFAAFFRPHWICIVHSLIIMGFCFNILPPCRKI